MISINTAGVRFGNAGSQAKPDPAKMPANTQEDLERLAERLKSLSTDELKALKASLKQEPVGFGIDFSTGLYLDANQNRLTVVRLELESR